MGVGLGVYGLDPKLLKPLNLKTLNHLKMSYGRTPYPANEQRLNFMVFSCLSIVFEHFHLFS